MMKYWYLFFLLNFSILKLGYSQTSLWISEVNFQSPSAGAIYLGSPSLVKLPDGSLLASHDYFGSSTSSDETAIFKSTDNGVTWVFQQKLKGVFWATLFYHKGSAYLLGTSAGVTYRSIVISKSTNGGATWTLPTSSSTGILFDKISSSNPVYHCAPTPVTIYNGRLYKGFERLVNASQSFRGYSAFAISIDENETDLLDASNWQKSTEVPYNTSSDLPNSVWNTGWIEGNIVEAPDGKLVNIMRVNSAPYVDKGAIIEIKDNGNTATFSATDFINLPGGMSKFAIRRDPVSKLYVLLTNNNTNPNYPEQRNILSMYVSSNLKVWHHAKTLMEDDLGLSPEQSIAKTGFQYPDFQFDGNDIIYLVRTAYNGANNFHNSNRITFGRVSDFKQYFTSEPTLTIGQTGKTVLNYNGLAEVYTTVRAGDGNIWLQQNLGSDRVANSRTDNDAYGDLFVWGRWDDGHHKREGALLQNGILSPNNPSALSKTGSNPYYYATPASNYFWYAGSSTDQLTGNLNAVNSSTGCDPCMKTLGENWRLPTKAELENLINTENITNYVTAYSSNLRIPSAGVRNVGNGELGNVGTLARLWSSDANNSGQAYLANFSNVAANTMAVSRGGGLSVRCIYKPKTTPVELINFRGSQKRNSVSLEWSVASQLNNSYYSIHKSPNGTDFYQIGKINSIGQSHQNYAYTDFDIEKGNNYYTLRQTDIDGKFNDLKTIVVPISLEPFDLNIIKRADALDISLNHPTVQITSLKIQTIEGKIVLQKELKLGREKRFSIENFLPKGIYVFTIGLDNGEVINKKIIL